MSDNKITKLDARNAEDLTKAISSADMILSKSYLSALNSSQIVSSKTTVEENSNFFDELNSTTRFFDVTQIVLNKKEIVRDKLVSVFNAVGTLGSSLIMMIRGNENSVSVSFGVKSMDSENIGKYSQVLEDSIKGNFPGTKLKPLRKSDIESAIKNNFPQHPAITSVTDVPGIRSEEENKDRQFIQGIEKFLDTMQGKEYTLLLIADPIMLSDMQNSRAALENLYSNLLPFCESQYTMGLSETEGMSSTDTKTVTDAVNESITKTVTHTVGKSTSKTNGKSVNYNANGATLGVTLGSALGSIIPGAGTIVSGVVGGLIGGALGSVGFGKNHSKTESENYSDAESHAENKGSSHSEGESHSAGTSFTTSSNRSLQIKFENHSVKKILERIDETLKRYDTCADVGMWICAVYCISEHTYISQMAASAYHSLIRGKNSSLEIGCVTNWDSDQSKLIQNSLMYMEHPFLDVNGIKVTPGTLVSSAELAIEAGLPNHSLPGLPVIECAEFGRTVSSYDKPESSEKYRVHLGNIYHMHSEEELPVKLNPKSLASHTFITGSTGAGKSNTVYQVLDKLKKIGVKFLVVEPAKGEYKNIFGTNADVSVYGTNPELMPLLRINPFSFPNRNADSYKNIHILEHLDRLVEIFNVCWPMYAAMPAVLKEAIEKSYMDCGWNLTESTNAYGTDLYPTFADVTRNIRTIIDSSEYDAENKGAYKGSLITRLKSLTNGINGLIFTDKEIEAEDLFDKNVIVDLSRVGSAETKSLIMGLLVLKLQEHRMTQGGMNSDLRHVTVLEEAHNLLKKTSTEQTQDSGNLQGKSVEMFTNSIAEMRTYGEGFIIADQAPALLDMAVIRNTNTKIIMRLPDQDDRELVGKAANLNNDQIAELAKLPRGVAAVYQNEWVEPVLCKVSHFEDDKKIYSYKHPEKEIKEDFLSEKIEIASLLFKGLAITDEARLRELKEKLWKLDLRGSTKVLILNAVKTPLESPRYTKLSPVISEFFPKVHSVFVSTFSRTSDNEQWSIDVDNAIREYVKSDIEEELLRSIRQCIITDYIHNELGKTELLEKWSLEGGAK